MWKVFLDCYIKISVLLAGADLFLALKAAKKNNTTGKFLGLTCLGAAVVDISYLVSILTERYLCVSVMSSVYFISIDSMLVCLLIFTVYYTKNGFPDKWKRAIRVIKGYVLFEIAVFTINPFWEIAVSYERRSAFFVKYSYAMKPLYWMHLGFTYVLVLLVIVLLLHKMWRLPAEYRNSYRIVILGILGIVAVNAVFLFLPGVTVYNFLDYSICAYSLVAFLLYWSCFNYATHGMLDCLKTSIFESIDQGIVLFDYEDNLILYNKKTEYLLGNEKPDGKMQDFLEKYKITLHSETESDSFSLQCYVNVQEGIRPLRCDVRRLKDKKNRVLGQLFVFSDIALETDLLTGFQTWESFKKFVKESPENFVYPTAVAICDINSLSIINSTYGHSVGDQKIKMLADVMRKVFPKTTYYVRGHEANLIALCSGDEERMQEYMMQVKKLYTDDIQYGTSVTIEKERDVLRAVHLATQGMRAKKLLDQKSVHSGILNSLIRALKECDSDIESHVQRTQLMGAKLGKRIGLTDMEQSDLSLLCLMHDIGKIGIPLEILNKPGKLSQEEWRIVQSHTEKGYRIANSNKELQEIADAIRHHHERWDGNGYPDGLSRESIPLLSRVIAVVDSYDAMTSNRPYRQAMPQEEAIAELRRCAGSQFDPFIVSEFLQILKKQPAAPAEEVQPVQQTSIDLEKSQILKEAKECSVHPILYSRYLLDDRSMIVSADENFEKLTGYTKEDLESTSLRQMDLIPEEERMEYFCQTSAGLANSPYLFLEHRIRKKDRTDVYVFCFGRLYYDSAVRAERSEIIITDISDSYSMKMVSEAEQSRAQIRMRYWERTYRRDSLTGLLNHAAFRSDVELKILEDKTKVMMLMLDVDKFKQYNDTFGHQAGDEFLILVGQTLMASLRKEDCACRMGGDEFAMALFFNKNISDQQMYKRAQQIFDKVNMTVKSVKSGTGISMGAAIVSGNIRTFNQLYKASDSALYRSKENGRGRLTVSEGWTDSEEPE